MPAGRITTIFSDIGGVLLTNGWDRHSRAAAAQQFQLELGEMDERHHLTFDSYEEGKLSLDEYLNRVVFYEPRQFSREEFRAFMFAQSKPYPEMLDLYRRLKARHGLKIGSVNNEGRELTEYRAREFNLKSIFDFFVSSCFVHFRKPDADIFRIALDIAQVSPDEVVYLEDRPMFVDVARDLGIHAIHHRGYDTTCKALAEFGLTP